MTDSPRLRRVLLVDDYPDAREMYSEYLKFSGFDVVEAGNGVEALQRAIETSPDIILMDLSLPVMDGWEATRRFRHKAVPSRGSRQGDPSRSRRRWLLVRLAARH
jgi:two-component system, cell cycle response regulator DivK